MSAQTPIDVLATVRDWLRYAVSRFVAAGLAFGHGSATALDEAAYLVLRKLNLPIDDVSPWLEARLLPDERAAILQLIEARIATRKPLAYLMNEAWIGGHSFFVDERVIVPRSYIGELLVADRLGAVVEDPDDVTSVLELCTGSGCLAILAALAFPAAKVTAVDVSGDALAVARRNVADYGLGERISLAAGDLLDGLGRSRFDLVLANPPYVASAAVQAFPPEWKAEPRLAHDGGVDGLDLVRRILRGVGNHLKPGGHLVMEIGTARTRLEPEIADLDPLWLDTEASEGEVVAISARELKFKQDAPG